MRVGGVGDTNHEKSAIIRPVSCHHTESLSPLL